MVKQCFPRKRARNFNDVGARSPLDPEAFRSCTAGELAGVAPPNLVGRESRAHHRFGRPHHRSVDARGKRGRPDGSPTRLLRGWVSLAVALCRGCLYHALAHRGQTRLLEQKSHWQIRRRWEDPTVKAAGSDRLTDLGSGRAEQVGQGPGRAGWGVGRGVRGGTWCAFPLFPSPP